MGVWQHSFCPSYYPQNGGFTTVKGQIKHLFADSCSFTANSSSSVNRPFKCSNRWGRLMGEISTTVRGYVVYLLKRNMAGSLANSLFDL